MLFTSLKSWWLCFAILFFSFRLWAQEAYLRGKVTEDKGEALEAATIKLVGATSGAISDSTGYFILKVPANTSITAVFNHLSYKEKQLTFQLAPGQVYEVKVVLERDTKVLSEIEVRADRSLQLKPEISIVTINPQSVKNLPSAFGDFTKILATLPGVVSNNELSSTYSVRGGSFDENLVYVNQIEVYRPFLARSGQQEGLSFINPDLVKGIEFSSGGWQPKFGDKLSSVLNITYKEPTKTAGSVTLGLLGGSLHLEGISRNKRISHITGIRQKQSQYLLGTLDVKGEYLPRFTDVQSYINIDLAKKRATSDSTSNSTFYPRSSLGVLMSYSRNRYYVEPTSRQTTFGTLDQQLRLFVALDGYELLNYDMYQGGIKYTYQPTSKFTTHFISSGMSTAEREYSDLDGYYRLCDIETAPGVNRFNQCLTTIGAGGTYHYSRNKLQANIFSFENRSTYQWGFRNVVEWGAKYSFENINDFLQEYNYTDSLDYITINESVATNLGLKTHRFSGYLQQTFYINSQHTLTYGSRLGYWSLNKQWLFSPSFQYAFKPLWEKEVIFKVAAGIYRQPPFYRELRNRAGELNKGLKAQSSFHLIVGAERGLKFWDRDFLLSTEVYYKYIWDAVAYDIDNVRIRYYANNNTKAYASGFDIRLSGEFIKGAESWFSLGLLNTKEDLGFDNRGYVRRPTDQRLTFSAFFQDHLPRNPTIRVYMNLIYGTGLPFSPPKRLEYRSAFSAPSYRRIDLGFSKIFNLRDKNAGLGKYIESLWLGAEVLNVVGVRNTISYTWVSDIHSRQFAVPNTLSARFLNLKLIAKF